MAQDANEALAEQQIQSGLRMVRSIATKAGPDDVSGQQEASKDSP